eukprot:COSAG01_NODE_2803_length_7047_cov_19.196891_1_plen_374_part_00
MRPPPLACGRGGGGRTEPGGGTTAAAAAAPMSAAALFGDCLRGCHRAKERVEELVVGADARRIGVGGLDSGTTLGDGDDWGRAGKPAPKSSAERLAEWQRENDRREAAAAAAAARGIARPEDPYAPDGAVEDGGDDSGAGVTEEVSNPLAADDGGGAAPEGGGVEAATADVDEYSYDDYGWLEEEEVVPLELAPVPRPPLEEEEDSPDGGAERWEMAVTREVLKLTSFELLLASLPDGWWEAGEEMHGDSVPAAASGGTGQLALAPPVPHQVDDAAGERLQAAVAQGTAAGRPQELMVDEEVVELMRMQLMVTRRQVCAAWAWHPPSTPDPALLHPVSLADRGAAAGLVDACPRDSRLTGAGRRACVRACGVV